MNYDKLLREIYYEWDRLWHNASLAGHLPEIQSEHESHLFWIALGESVGFWQEDLSRRIEADYGIDLTFWSYGRQGATVAPSEWMDGAAYGGFGSFSQVKTGLLDVDGLDRFNRARQVLAVLRLINKYWRDTAEYVPIWWRETKDANGWNELEKER